MMPLDARFATIPTPANDTRAPDEGDARRPGEGNPFGGLLAELGRPGAASDEPSSGRAAAPATDASADPAQGNVKANVKADAREEAVADALGEPNGPADLARLIDRALGRTAPGQKGTGRAGAPGQGTGLHGTGAPTTLAAQLRAASAAAAEALRGGVSEADQDNAKAAPTDGEAAALREEGLTSDTVSAGLANPGAAQMAATAALVVAAPSAGPPAASGPSDDPHPAGRAPAEGAAGGPALPQAAENGDLDAPALRATVIDVQTHFAPIRSLASGGSIAAARDIPAAGTGASTRAAPVPRDGGQADATADLNTAVGSPAAGPPGQAVPSAPWGASAASLSRTAMPAASTPQAVDRLGSGPQVVPPRADTAGQAHAVPDSPDRAGRQDAALAAAAETDRPLRRAEPAAAPRPALGASPAADPAPGTRPVEGMIPGREADAHGRGRDDGREDHRAPALASASAGVGTGRLTAPDATGALSGAASAATPGTAAVASAIAEAAGRLTRANAGVDLSVAPRPGDPVRIMEIALAPEGLGTVTVRLRLTSDGLEVRVRASDAGTAALLQQDKAQLAGILREFGCSEDRMDVSGPDASAIGASAGADLRPTAASASDDSRGDGQRGQQGDRSQGGFQGGFQGGSGRNEGRHDDQGSRTPARGAVRDPGFDSSFDLGIHPGFDPGLRRT